MATLRSDAVRSRARILEIARTHSRTDLRLNEVAREAGVGVGTVYRHFPTVGALIEAISATTITQMLTISRQARDEPDAAAALSFYLRSALALQLEDDGLQTVLLSPADEAEEVRAAKREIFETFSALLETAKAAGAVRPDLTVMQVAHLVCGIEYAVRLGSLSDREGFLDILLGGLRP